MFSISILNAIQISILNLLAKNCKKTRFPIVFSSNLFDALKFRQYLILHLKNVTLNHKQSEERSPCLHCIRCFFISISTSRSTKYRRLEGHFYLHFACVARGHRRMFIYGKTGDSMFRCYVIWKKELKARSVSCIWVPFYG